MAGQLGLQELFQQIRILVYGIWRKRWYMILSAWIVCLLGWMLTMSMPYRYTSKGTLFMNTKVILELLKQPISNNKSNDLAKLRSYLLDAKTIQNIIDRSDLSPRIKTDADKQRVVASMRNNITIRPTMENTYIIEYEASETILSEEERRKFAKLVVEQLMQRAKDISPAVNDRQAESQKNFIEGKLREAKAAAEITEQEVNKYETEHIRILNTSDPLRQLEKAQNDLKAARSDAAVLEKTIELTKSQLSSIDTHIYKPRESLVGGTSKRSSLEGRLRDQQKKLDELVARGVKEKHPYYILVKKSIDEVRAEMVEEDKRIESMIEEAKKQKKSTKDVDVIPNERYEATSLKLTGLQEQLITQNQIIKEKSAEVVEYREMIENRPVILSKFDDLKDQDRSAQREVNRWESELKKVNEKIEGSSVNSAVVETVNPASNPSGPSGPPRLLFLTASLMGGVMVGLGVALLLSQIRPVVLSVEQLRDHFDLPVLGNVTVMLDEEAKSKKRKDMIFFGLAASGMFGLYFLLIVVDTINI